MLTLKDPYFINTKVDNRKYQRDQKDGNKIVKLQDFCCSKNKKIISDNNECNDNSKLKKPAFPGRFHAKGNVTVIDECKENGGNETKEIGNPVRNA